MQITQRSESEIEIKKAAQLSIAEIGLGSIGHGFKIPLTGQILSINQLGFLLNAINSDKLSKYSAFEISSIAAILKSFSPAGQKLGPMLSIAMQGFLFWLSLVLFGGQLIGQLVGAVLLSLWSFVQPLITLFMVYGLNLTKLSEFYFKKMNEDYAFIAMAIIYAVLTVLTVKIILAVVMVILSLKFNKKIQIIANSKLSAVVSRPSSVQNQSALQGALKDLVRPIFLLSFILMLIFVWQINGALSEKIWLALRPLATAFVIFYLLRSPWFAEKLLGYSKKSKTFEKFYIKSKKAFEVVKAGNDNNTLT